ncbi:CHAD domain-containing protein [Alcanivorax hongdengensis A-11-3]|uniref:CHAD domain-containing protein n=1 Tax=Alcanivorax hongdengensis A-11-3 TaxID=1177179 RepID=L0WAD1_9GAMM|nr:CHAD domain-containing protein [Alcanivorax hongdengensis]EKF73901.1 CHAD domain-containing protein [Alcanivorax hongdengensis A-11-3]
MTTPTLIRQLTEQARQRDEQALGWLQSGAPSPQAVHDIRVIIKQQRASWQLLRPWLCRDDHRTIDRALGQGAKALATARDQHVMAQTLDNLARKTLKHRRQELKQAHRHLLADSPPPEPPGVDTTRQALHDDLQQWQRLNLVVSDHELLATGLARTYKQCRNRTIKALGSHQAEPWHDLRKWVKYLLYQQQDLSAGGIPAITDHTSLEKLGNKLGKLHDLEVLRQFLQHHPDRKTAKPALQAIAEREQQLLKKCQRKSQALFHAPTRKWIRAVL